MKKLSLMKHQQPRVLGLAACAVLCMGPVVACGQVYAAPPYAPPANVAPPYVPPAYVNDYDKDLGFYVGGNVGPSFMPNFQSHRFGFPGDFHMDAGVRSGAEVGYNFLATRAITLGGEFETGAIYNKISRAYDQGMTITRRGDFYQVPMLGNLVLKFHPNSQIVPYIGVGGGGDASWARLNSWGFYGYDHKSDKVDPAAQGMAGVRFKLNSQMDVGLGYKFLADFPGTGKYIATHSATASFTVRF
jgi:opacity protein-like surface antigen